MYVYDHVQARRSATVCHLVIRKGVMMLKKRLFCMSCIVAACLMVNDLSAAPFYEGKVLRITVGFSAGGGFDAYARAVARHLGKHIPGNPTVVVENIVGAGGVIQVSSLYGATKPDGLTMGYMLGGLFFGQLVGQPGFNFDARRFIYVGAPMKENNVIALSKASGVTSLEQWRQAKTPLKLSGLVPGNTLDNTVRVFKEVSGLPIQLVTGYKGTADMRMAIESGEVAGCAWSWDSLKSTWRKALDSGNAIVVVQGVPKALPDLPKVPLLISLAKTDEARQLVEMCVHTNILFNRSFALPPGTPRERVEILRNAFEETMKDKDFLAETEKANLAIDSVTGEGLEKAVAQFFKMDSAMVTKVKQVLFN